MSLNHFNFWFSKNAKNGNRKWSFTDVLTESLSGTDELVFFLKE